MTDIQKLTARVETLESQVAFQEQTIEDLNSAITNQWTEFDKLNRRISKLTSELEELEVSAGGSDIVERPPHY